MDASAFAKASAGQGNARNVGTEIRLLSWRCFTSDLPAEQCVVPFDALDILRRRKQNILGQFK
jgi:hypothetical protein